MVARNPDDESTLGFLLRIPLDDGLFLKASAPWPASARVYCHPVDVWPGDAEIIEEVAVRRCARRGRAIDLVLDRARNNRSQIIFTESRPGRSGAGRPLIFWQTAQTARRSRPGQRVPGGQAAGGGAFAIVVDTRERYAYRFANRAVERVTEALPAGDYAVRDGDRLVAVVERKRFDDFVKTLIDGSLSFQLAELAAAPAAAVVIEERYSALTRVERAQPTWLLELVARLQVRYPAIPLVFADSRKMAEEWTFRFLAAALAQHGGESEVTDSLW